jgi:transcriptional regulator with XRE-family HTH domain
VLGDKSALKKEKDPDYSQQIAGKVNYLFETFRKPDGRKYNFTEVAEGTGLHSSWLSKLAAGRFSRPGLQVLQALTKFFQVDPGFWFTDLNEWIIEREETEAQKKSLSVALDHSRNQMRVSRTFRGALFY